MKRELILIGFIIIFGCKPVVKIDRIALSEELDSIMAVDQNARGEMSALDSASKRAIILENKKTDASNLKRIVEIIKEVGGYPGKSLVGNHSGKVVFFVLQHAPENIQMEYYDLIVEAGRAGELNREYLSMYTDRYLMHKGEPQIYGSQIWSEARMDSLTGEKVMEMVVWPIRDTTKIDSVRMWNGLGPLEEYLNGFGLSRWE